MPTEFTLKRRKRTLSTEPTPIEFFDPSTTPCPNWLRRRCLGLLSDASLDQASAEAIEDRIQSPELTEAEGLELSFYLQAHGKQVSEYYAPSQRMIAAHIRRICRL
jgi:hypothetical protein